MNPPSDYSPGVPLTSPTGPDHLFVGSWNDAALVDGTSALIFGISGYGTSLQVRDGRDRELPRGEADVVIARRHTDLIEVLRKMREMKR